jgi:hypothetical protein
MVSTRGFNELFIDELVSMPFTAMIASDTCGDQSKVDCGRARVSARDFRTDAVMCRRCERRMNPR